MDDDAPRSEEDDDDRAPICPACGVTMVPAALGAHADGVADDGWICLECEETGGPDGG